MFARCIPPVAEPQHSASDARRLLGFRHAAIPAYDLIEQGEEEYWSQASERSPPDYYPLGDELRPGWWVRMYDGKHQIGVVGETPSAWLLEVSFWHSAYCGKLCEARLGGQEGFYGLVVSKDDGAVSYAVLGPDNAAAKRVPVRVGGWVPELLHAIENPVPSMSICFSDKVHVARERKSSEGAWTDDRFASSLSVYRRFRRPPSSPQDEIHHDLIRQDVGPIQSLLVRRRVTTLWWEPPDNTGITQHTIDLVGPPGRREVTVGGQSVQVATLRYTGDERFSLTPGGYVSVWITQEPVIAALSPALVTAPSWGVVRNTQSTVADGPARNTITGFGTDYRAHITWPDRYSSWIEVRGSRSR